MHASVYLNIGKILLLPAPLAAFHEPQPRLPSLFTSLIIPLLRLFFRRYSVRWYRMRLELCGQSFGLSWVLGGVK
jgi:hypothetical protein